MAMRLTTLFENAELWKPGGKIYKVDQLFDAHSHTVIRLPPYTCDLSLIELTHSKLEYHMYEQEVLGDISMKNLEEIGVQELNLTQLGVNYCLN
jgi:hypothetical protein